MVDSDSKSKVELGNKWFAVYLLYIIFILMCDAADLICFILNFKQATIISRVCVFLVFIGITYVCTRKCRVKKAGADLEFCIFALIIMLFGFFKGVYPDLSCDVDNYHLLLQSPGFLNNFNYNIAPGDFQLFGFGLPDRMFYLFRLLLGYRMGTLFNSLIIVLIYFQVYNLIKELFSDKLNEIRKNSRRSFGKWFLINIIFTEAFLAFVIVITHDVSLQFGSYMIDLFAVPIALEMIRIILTLDLNKEEGKQGVYYFAFLTGILFCIKMTNIVYLFPLLVIFICKNIKKIKISTFIICFIIGVLPVSIYLIYNYIVTGNPIFPYYNKIFSSPYFPLVNFKDTRWGPSNIKEIILWPLYLVFNPKYRQSEIYNIWPISFIGGLIASVYFALKKLKLKENYKNKCALLYIIFFVSMYLWTITTGHIRYFILGYIFNGILLIDFFVEVLYNKRSVYNGMAIIFVFLFSVGSVGYLYCDFMGREWSWREFDKKTYLQNFAQIFRDRDFASYEQSKKIDVFLLNDKSRGSLAYLINEDVPIIYNTYVHDQLSDEKKAESLKRIDEYFNNGKNIYDIFFPDDGSFEDHLNKLDKYGIKLTKMEWLDGHLLNRDNLILFKLQKLKDGENNKYYYASIADKNKVVLNDCDDNISVNACMGFINDFGWLDKNNINFQIKISDGTKEKVFYAVPVKEGEFYNLNEEFNIKDFSKNNINIEFNIADNNGNIRHDIEPYKFVIVNPKFGGCKVVE